MLKKFPVWKTTRVETISLTSTKWFGPIADEPLFPGFPAFPAPGFAHRPGPIPLCPLCVTNEPHRTMPNPAWTGILCSSA